MQPLDLDREVGQSVLRFIPRDVVRGRRLGADHSSVTLNGPSLQWGMRRCGLGRRNDQR